MIMIIAVVAVAMMAAMVDDDHDEGHQEGAERETDQGGEETVATKFDYLEPPPTVLLMSMSTRSRSIQSLWPKASCTFKFNPPRPASAARPPKPQHSKP